jgi:hypothetical protein
LDSLNYFYNLNVKDNMNKRIKELALKSFESVKNTNIDSSNMEAYIDAYVLEMTKNVVFACSDVVREQAKTAEPAVAKALKVAAVDMLDEFGL